MSASQEDCRARVKAFATSGLVIDAEVAYVTQHRGNPTGYFAKTALTVK